MGYLYHWDRNEAVNSFLWLLSNKTSRYGCISYKTMNSRYSSPKNDSLKAVTNDDSAIVFISFRWTYLGFITCYMWTFFTEVPVIRFDTTRCTHICADNLCHLWFIWRISYVKFLPTWMIKQWGNIVHFPHFAQHYQPMVLIYICIE